MTEHRLEQAALAELADVGHAATHHREIAKAGDASKQPDQTRLEMLLTGDDNPGFTDTKVADVEETSGKTSVKTSKKILSLIRKNPVITIFELALSIGVIKRSVERNLKKRQEELRLSRIGSAKGGHWKASA